MGNTVNRDRLRGIVSELQTMTGKRVSATRHLMSKRDCYNAIYELMKLELGINTKKENETLKRLNKTLNEVNCEVNQDREELRKEIKNLKSKILYLENKKSYYCNRFVTEMMENLGTQRKNKLNSRIIKTLCMVVTFLVGGLLCWLFA